MELLEALVLMVVVHVLFYGLLSLCMLVVSNRTQRKRMAAALRIADRELEEIRLMSIHYGPRPRTLDKGVCA
jgi:hypothetical protein